jgi:signal peptidase II
MDGRLLAWGLTALVVLGADQGSKALVRAFPSGEPGWGFPGLAAVVHLENPGAALGLLGDLAPGTRAALFGLGGVALVAVALAWTLRLDRGARLLPIALGAVVGGALGNTLDRLLRGSVTDWLRLGAAPLEALTEAAGMPLGAPAFNVADVALGAGLVTVVGAVLLRSRTAPDTA